MPRYRATLSATLNVTANSPGQAERYARDDAAQFLADNTHELDGICEVGPDEEETMSTDELTFSASVESEDYVEAEGDENDADEVVWDADVSFDVVFEAESLSRASEMAIGIPYQLCCCDKVEVIARDNGLPEPALGSDIDKIHIDGIGEFDVDRFRTALSEAMSDASFEVEEGNLVVTLPPAPGMAHAAAPAC